MERLILSLCLLRVVLGKVLQRTGDKICNTCASQHILNHYGFIAYLNIQCNYCVVNFLCRVYFALSITIC